MSIFEDLAAGRPDLFPNVEETGPLPVVPAVAVTSLLAVVGGENDHLVRRTFNGLRPADVALEQPPQHPEWRPCDDR